MINKTLEWLLILTLTSIVFSLQISAIILGLFVLIALLSKKRLNQISNTLKIYFILNVLYLTVILISSFASENLLAGLKFLERFSSVLFVPAIFIFFNLRELNLNRILKGHLIGITGIMFYAIVVAFIKNQQFNESQQQSFINFKSWFFTYHYLAGNVNSSAIYLSLFLGIAIFVLLLDLLGWNSLGLRIRNWLKYLWFAFLMTGLILLFARTILLFVITAVIIVLAITAIRKNKKLIFTASLVTVACGLIVLIQTNDVLRLRLGSVFKSKAEAKYFSGNLDSRIIQWDAIVTNTWAENKLIGVGVGDLDSNYEKIYKTNGLEWASQNRFNAHNMYVELFHGTGFVGLGMFLSLFGLSLYLAMRARDWRHLLFLFLFSVAGLTESIMNRQQGIFFWVIFNTVFLVYTYQSNKTLGESNLP